MGDAMVGSYTDAASQVDSVTLQSIARPLVSCIMPTKNRRKFLPQAIASYLHQLYAPTELIIVDNGEDGSEEVVPQHASIYYHRVQGQYNVGDMRNFCCALAQGDIICHFDSDDWSRPERVGEQVKRLVDNKLDVTSYSTLLFYEQRKDKLFLWSMSGRFNVSLGTGLCYWKKWWESHRFMSLPYGEDSRFWMQAGREGKIMSVPAGNMIIGRVHESQTVGKPCVPPRYVEVGKEYLPKEFPRAL